MTITYIGHTDKASIAWKMVQAGHCHTAIWDRYEKVWNLADEPALNQLISRGGEVRQITQADVDSEASG